MLARGQKVTHPNDFILACSPIADKNDVSSDGNTGGASAEQLQMIHDKLAEAVN